MKRMLRLSALLFFMILLLSGCAREDNAGMGKNENQKTNEVQQKSSQYQNSAGNTKTENKVNAPLNYIGVKIDKIVEDAKYTGGLVRTHPKETVLPYLKCYKPRGGEVYFTYVPKQSTGRNWVYLAVIDGSVVAAGFLPADSGSNVYKLIRETPFVGHKPHIIDNGNGNGKDLVWKAQNGTFNIRASSAAGNENDYKTWLVTNYCCIVY